MTQDQLDLALICDALMYYRRELLSRGDEDEGGPELKSLYCWRLAALVNEYTQRYFGPRIR